MKTKYLLCLLSLLSVPVWIAEARVKLVALPERARVVVSLNNPDATLVEEERLITLQKGVNKVDFSWRGVNIDSTSIQARMLTHPDAVIVLNTSYPPNENALIWEISSPSAQEERVRISYLLSGLGRDVVYKAVAEPDEKALTLRNYLRLRNDSGEDLTDAEIGIGYGYCSGQEAVAHFGLGAATATDLTIRWTNGSVEKIPNVAADQLVVVREGAGIIRKQKF